MNDWQLLCGITTICLRCLISGPTAEKIKSLCLGHLLYPKTGKRFRKDHHCNNITVMWHSIALLFCGGWFFSLKNVFDEALSWTIDVLKIIQCPKLLEYSINSCIEIEIVIIADYIDIHASCYLKVEEQLKTPSVFLLVDGEYSAKI